MYRNDKELFDAINANCDEYGMYTVDKGDYMAEYWYEVDEFGDAHIYWSHWCKETGCFATMPEEIGFVPLYLL